MKTYAYLGSDWDVGDGVCGKFRQSLDAAGLVPADPYSADLTFCWGQRRRRDNHTIIFDLGYIDRAWDAFKNTGHYYQASIGQVGWLPGLVFDEQRAERLNVVMGSRPTEGPVVICGQVPGDAQHDMSEEELRRWFEVQIDKLALSRNGDLFWRPHPQAADCVAPGLVPTYHGDKTDVLTKARTVLTYNSTIGLEALFAGRLVVCSPDAFYSYYADSWLLGIDRRRELLDRVAYAQWTEEEIGNGACWGFLKTQIHD